MTASPRAGGQSVRREEGRAADVRGRLKSVSEESDFDGPFIDYKAKGNQIELVGKEELQGKPAYRIKLTNKNGNIRFIFLTRLPFCRRSGKKRAWWKAKREQVRDANAQLGKARQLSTASVRRWASPDKACSGRR